MKTILAIFAGILVIFAAIVFVLNYRGGNTSEANKPTVKVDNHSFTLLLAKTSQEQQVGLSNRDSLPKDQGMLFLFSKPGIYPFWMKDMRFPIDIIFINKDKIITIHKNVPPPTSREGSLPLYSPAGSSDKVLEINAGLSDQYGIKEGDTIQLENL